MKKLIALVLAAVLTLACVNAAAANNTVDYKFYRQIYQNGTKAVVTLSAEGDSFSLFPDDVWATIRVMAPALRLEMQNCINKKGSGQSSAQLLMNGQEMTRMDAVYNADTVCLRWPALSAQWLSAPKDWEWSRLATALANDETDVPPLWHLLTEVLSAPAEWRTLAAPYAEKYQAALGVWVNGFAVSSTGVDENGVRYSELRCTVPAEELKSELKKLLGQVYGDAGLLTLLCQVALPEETAYLTPAALPYFTGWVEEMRLAEAVEIVRRFDAMAQPLLDSVRLPFAEGQALSCLTVDVAAAAEGQRCRVLAERPDGTGLEVIFTQADAGHFSGDAKILSADGQAAGFRYDGSFTLEDETYSLTTDLCERKLHGELNLKPLEGTPLPPMQAALEVLFSTRSEKRSPSEMTASLQLRDGAADASLTLRAEVRTTEPWKMDTVDTLTDVRRLDRMTMEEWRALLTGIGNGPAFTDEAARDVMPEGAENP